MSAKLKVKLKSLASEIKIIKHEERKTKARYRDLKGRQGFENKYDKTVDLFWDLRSHRNGLSLDARDSHLAYAYVRGKRYRQAENTGNPVHRWFWSYQKKEHVPIYAVDLSSIARMASQYGGIEVDEAEIARWIHEEDLNEVVAEMDAASA